MPWFVVNNISQNSAPMRSDGVDVATGDAPVDTSRRKRIPWEVMVSRSHAYVLFLYCMRWIVLYDCVRVVSVDMFTMFNGMIIVTIVSI